MNSICHSFISKARQSDRIFGKPLNRHLYMHKFKSWLIIRGVVSPARNPLFVTILISPHT